MSIPNQDACPSSQHRRTEYGKDTCGKYRISTEKSHVLDDELCRSIKSKSPHRWHRPNQEHCSGEDACHSCGTVSFNQSHEAPTAKRLCPQATQGSDQMPGNVDNDEVPDELHEQY